MSDRIVESLNEMKQIYLESVSGQVVSERDEYLQYIEEKMKKMKKKDEEEDKEDEEDKYEKEDDADQDYDEDGEIESGEEEHAGSVHNAIQRKMGGIPDGNPPKRRKKSMKESFSDWRNELYEKVGDVESDIENSKQKKIEEKSGINNKIDINPNVNIGEQVELSEEYIEEVVDVAAQYFYEQGLNEEGLEMVIEELGYDKFVEYVFYISEDFVLTEARTLLGKKKAPAKGKERGISLRAAPGKTTAAAAKEHGTTRRFSSFNPTGTVRKKVVKSQGDDAVEKTIPVQPKSRPVLDALARRIASATEFVKKGIERDKAARGELSTAARKTSKTLGKAAKGLSTGAGEFARGFGSGATGTLSAAQKIKKSVVGEEIEAFLLEKSESQQQQKLFGLALSVKRGETPRSEVSKAVLDIVDGMSEKEIRKFAKTPHKGLPNKAEG